MNLYDKDDGFREFTLEEANALLPKIIVTTAKSVSLLEKTKQLFDSEKEIDEKSAEEKLENKSAEILHLWAEKMASFGVYPKGYFTVDFKSHIPDTLLCWSFGEKVIRHTHKTYERFKDRVKIKDKEFLGFENSLN